MDYIRFTNGAVTYLINVNDSLSIENAISNGFNAELDSQGYPAIIKSSTLISSGKSGGALDNVMDIIKSKGIR